MGSPKKSLVIEVSLENPILFKFIMAKEEYYKELFTNIDLEDDGIVYLKEIVIYLRAMNEDIDDNLEVKVLLDQYETNGEEELKFKHFCEIMLELEDAGWKKAKEKSADQVTDIDIKSVFNLVDIDKSGTVSRTEARMAAKLLEKSFGIKDVKGWLKQNDADNDGRLSYMEFKKSLKNFLNPQGDGQKQEAESGD